MDHAHRFHDHVRRSLGFTNSSLLVISIALMLVQPTGAAYAAEDEAPAGAEAEDAGSGTTYDWTRPGAIALDLVILRPLGAVATAVGSAAFAVSSPFVAPSGNFRASWETFVLGPLEYTFERPLGEL